jgi:hypothetical protein
VNPEFLLTPAKWMTGKTLFIVEDNGLSALHLPEMPENAG